MITRIESRSDAALGNFNKLSQEGALAASNFDNPPLPDVSLRDQMRNQTVEMSIKGWRVVLSIFIQLAILQLCRIERAIEDKFAVFTDYQIKVAAPDIHRRGPILHEQVLVNRNALSREDRSHGGKPANWTILNYRHLAKDAAATTQSSQLVRAVNQIEVAILLQS